jgi:FkbM family methyltransferase
MRKKSVKKAIKRFIGLESTKEKFKRHVASWFVDKGDETLRLQYPLTENSIVWDVGGYHGDFAEKMVSLYGCTVYVFEPLEKFFAQCEHRFAGNARIKCFNYGLAEKEGWFDISDEEDASSFDPVKSGTATLQAQLRPVADVFNELGDNRIDLLKINIEGGEFDLLPAMI